MVLDIQFVPINLTGFRISLISKRFHFVRYESQALSGDDCRRHFSCLSVS